MPNPLLIVISGLKNKNLVSPHKEAAEVALDAILKVDLSKVTAMGELNTLINDNIFLKDQDIKPLTAADDLSAIKKETAEQRVLMGLQTAADSILINILKNNPGPCRDYIATRPELGNLAKTVNGWPLPTADQAPAIAIISSDFEKSVREQAALLVLSKLINSAKQADLKTLIDAKDGVELQAAVKKLRDASSLKFPDEGLSALPALLPTALKDAAIQRYVPIAFKAHIDTLDFTNLSTVKATLEQDDHNFAAYVRTSTNLVAFPDSLRKEALGMLGLRYLQEALAQSDKAVLNAINKATPAEMQGELKAILPGNDAIIDIDGVTTEKNMSAINTTLTQNLIKKVEFKDFKVLEELAAATDMAKFKAGLGRLGITSVDWVSEEQKTLLVTALNKQIHALKSAKVQTIVQSTEPSDVQIKKFRELAEAKDLPAFNKVMQKLGHADVAWVDAKEMYAIQQAARDKVFSLQLDSVSTLGAKAHPQLLKALATLPFESQNRLLADGKRATLHALLNVTDEQELKRIFNPKLADDVQIIQDLAKENERLAVFRQIHNAAFAEVLAGIQPPIPLTTEQVEKINDRFTSDSDDFEVQLLPIFGLDRIADIERAFNDAITTIDAQQTTNLPLLELYHEPKPSDPSSFMQTQSQRNILETLLKLNVEVAYAKPADVLTQLNKLLKDNHSSLEGFLKAVGDDTKLVADKNQRAALKQALSLELTEARYAEIQQQRRAELLQDPRMTLTVVQDVIKEMVDSLNDMKVKQKPILDTASKLTSLIDSQVFKGGSLSFPPAFDEAVKKSPGPIKAEFDELLAKTTAIIDHLEANKKIIEGHLASLAAARPTPADPEIPKSIKKLQSNLEAELKVLTEKLDKYKQAKVQIGQMVTEIDRVVSGKREDVYQGVGVKVHRCNAAELEGIRQRANVADLSQGPIPLTSQQGLSGKKEIGGTGQLYVHEVVNRNDQGALTKGVFVQSFDGPDSAKTEKGERTPSCKIEVLQTPVLTKDIPRIGGADPQPKGAQVTREDKANFYLNMAMAMLTANGGKAPTKDNPIRLSGGTKEEMECLWTAFKLIGQDSKLKFGEDAIKIVSGSFLPSQARGVLGFNKTSAYATVFKGSAALDIKLKEADQMATDSKTAKKELSDATQNTSGFKGQFQEQKSLWQKRPGGSTPALDALNLVTAAIPTPDAKADLSVGLRK